MAFVDMNAIDFYKPPPPRTDLPGDKRPPASNRNVPTIGQQRESRQAFGSSNWPSWSHPDYDPIEIQDMTTPSPNEPLDSLGKLGPEVQAAEVENGDMVNEPCVIRRRDRTGSDASQGLPSVEELLFDAIKMQEPQRAGGSGAHLTRRSDKSLGHAVENNWRESDSPKSGWGESSENPILLDGSVHTSESSTSEEQNREQGGERSSLSTPLTSVASSEARSSTLHRKNEFLTPQATTPRHHSCSSSTACPQIHESIYEGRHSIENDPSTSGDKRNQWDDKAAEADNEGRGLQEGNNEKSALLRPTKKRCRSAARKKLPLERHVKRHRYSSPLSCDEETETEPESDTSSYASELCRTSNLRPPSSSSLSIGREREPSADDALEGANRRSKRLSRTAVVYEQQCWEGEIMQERDVRQERGRPRKQYLVRWKDSWVDGARLAAPELLRNWRETKMSSKRKC